MPRDRTRAAYRRLLGLYPRRFRERFAESMVRTFDDLRRERRAAGSRMLGFTVWMFVETSLGVAGEHVAALSRARLARHHRFARAVIAIPMATMLYGIGEELYRCEIRGLPNCD